MRKSALSRHLVLFVSFALALGSVQSVAAQLPGPEPINPWVGIAPDDDTMWGGSGWAAGNTIDITIDDPAVGALVYSTTIPVVPGSPSDDWRLELGGIFDILPGQIVTVTDSVAGIVKTHEVRGFSVDLVNTITDTIEGTAPAGVELGVKVLFPESCTTTAIADGSGLWSASFAGLLSEAGQPCDIDAGWSGSAEWTDATDNDNTFMGWHAMDATIFIMRDADLISGVGWEPASDATITVQRETSPGAWTELGSWITPVGEGEGFDFAVSLDIVAGDLVSVTGAAAGSIPTITEKTHNVTTIDYVESSINDPEGTVAFAGAEGGVIVGQAWGLDGSYAKRVMDPGTLAGTLDFAAPGPHPDDWGAVNGAIESFFIDEHDLDGNDSTAVQWSAPVYNQSFNASLTNDWVDAWGFTPGASVTFAIFDSVGGMELFSGSRPTDVDGRYFLEGWEHGIDLIPGMFVTVTDDTTLLVKDLVLESLTLDVFDVAGDIVSGTAADAVDGRLVNVGVGNEFFGCSFDVPVAAGIWTANFVDCPDGPFDITSDMGGSAQLFDADGDATLAEPPHIQVPFFNASLTSNWVNASRFTPGASVTFAIFDSVGGMELFSGSRPTDVDGHYFLEDWEHGIDLIPGMHVTVTDDTNSLVKDLVLENLTLDSFDAAGDIVSGTAPDAIDGRMVTVDVGNEFFGCGFDVPVTAGTWTANFVDCPDGPFDVTSDMGGSAHLYDADGDATVAEPIEPPSFEASLTNDWVNAWGFSPGGSVTFAIYDAPGGTELFTGSRPTDLGGYYFLDGGEHGIDLMPGMFVTVTDDTNSLVKDLVLESLTLDVFDVAGDIVAGTAQDAIDGRLVNVGVGNEFFGCSFDVPVTAGIWTANFVDCPEGPFNITSDMGGSAQLFDADGDATVAEPIEPPRFEASLTNDWVNASGLTPGASVTFAIFDSVGGTELFTGSRPTDLGGYYFLDGGEHGIDLMPGMFVTVTDDTNSLVKDLVLENLALDPVDFAGDNVSGTAPDAADGRTVTVGGGNEFVGCSFGVSVAAGLWVANFADCPEGPFDIAPGMNISAQLYDEDGDSTLVENPEPPFFEASLESGWIAAIGYTAGSSVTYAIYDAVGGTQLFSVTRPTDTTGHSFLDGAEHGIDLIPGMAVTVTDDTTLVVKDLVLENLTVDSVDFDTGDMSGTAVDAVDGRMVFVGAAYENGAGCGFEVPIIAGTWTVNFADCPDGPFAIAPDMMMWAQLNDIDGDTTYREWPIDVAIGPIAVELGDVLISQTDGVLWVYNPDTGSLTDYRYPFGGTWDIQWFDDDTILIANSQDARIWALTLSTGDLELIAVEGLLGFPIGLALEDNGEVLWIADHETGILRMDLVTGIIDQIVPVFAGPMDGIVVVNGVVYFTDQSGTLWRVDDAADGGYSAVVEVGPYVLNGLVETPSGDILASSMSPSALVTIDPYALSVTIDEFAAGMRSSEDAAFAATGDIYISDSGLVAEFGDDPGLYVLREATGVLEELHRGAPLGDIVDVLIKRGHAPQIIDFTGPVDPYPLGLEMFVAATFTDLDGGEPYVARMDWGDGNVSYGVVTFDGFNGTVDASHFYATADVYTVTLTLHDSSGEMDAAEFNYAVVVDPDGKRLHGNGEFVSGLSEVEFGISLKYRKGTLEPKGKVKVEIEPVETGDEHDGVDSDEEIEFESSSIDWLWFLGDWALAGGTMTLDDDDHNDDDHDDDGATETLYGFVVAAFDDPAGNDGDRIRIKIWLASDPTVVVFDSQSGDPNLAFPTTPLVEGKIKIKTR